MDNLVSVFNFSKVVFPTFDYISKLDRNKVHRLQIFDLGFFGKGYLKFFEDGYNEVRFITTDFSNGKDGFCCELISEGVYDWFCNQVKDYMEQVFKVELDCSNTWD